MRIATESDLASLEANGFDTVFPHQSPWEILQASARAWPEAEAIRYLTDGADTTRWESITYAGLRDRVAAAGALFRALGVGPGDSVGLLVGNTLWGQVALWGAQLAGAACPINPMLRPEHVASLLRHANARVVVAMGVNPEQDWWSALIPVLRAEGVALPILDCDATAPCPGSDGDFGALVTARLGETLQPAGDRDSTAGWYHTGGTTGQPKLVHHSRLNQAHVARSCEIIHDLQSSDVVVNGFPLFHVAGAFVYGLSALSAGAVTVIPGRLGMRNQAFTGTIWQQVARHRVTVLAAVPTMMAAWVAVPVDADISSVRVMLTGGSPLPSELAQRFERLTGVPVRNILGMTECAGAVALEPVHGARIPLSCGLRLPFTEVCALDPNNTAQPLGHGQTGILALKGPNVSSGYSDPARNAGTFEHGWLVSGDLGRVEADGRVYITGRAKDLIIRGGHNIDPQGIEDALLAHPSVLAAAAVGMPDAYAGELPVAFVTLADAVSPEALRDFLADVIPEPAAMPKRIEPVEAMPLTPIGKIFKPALRRIATGWAVEATLQRAGVPAAIEVDEGMAVAVTLTSEDVENARNALAGMPVHIDFRVSQ